MKKILFLILCFSLSFSAKALEKKKIENVFYKIDGQKELKQAYYLQENNKPIYFLNPNFDLEDIDNEVNTIPNLNQEQLEYVTYANKIALDNKDNIKYYLSVQEMIASKLSNVMIEWYDEKGEKINNLTEYLDIRNKIESNIKRASFHNTTIQNTYNSQVTLEDTNNVINEYEVVPNKNIVNIDGNKVYMTLREIGNKKTIFKKVIQNGENGHFYQGGSQYYVDLGTDVIITSVLNTDVSIKPQVSFKVTSNGKQINKALSLEFKDENSNTFMDQTDSNGTLKREMEIGKYQVTILNLPINFINKTFTLNVSEQEEIDFDINLDEIRGNLFLKRKGFYLNHQGKQFENLSNVIYDIYASDDINNYLGETYLKNELITSLTLNELGEVNYSLPLGSYYIVERNSYPYQSFKDEFAFTFDQDNLNVSKTITTEHIPMQVKTLNTKENDIWSLCYMIDGNLECLDSSDYYNIPFSEYIFVLKRKDKIIEFNYNFTKEDIVELDFDKFFKEESDNSEEKTNSDDNTKTSTLIDEGNKKNNENDKKESESKIKTLPKTSSKASLLFLNISLLVTLYLFVKKGNR